MISFFREAKDESIRMNVSRKTAPQNWINIEAIWFNLKIVICNDKIWRYERA